MKDYNCAVFEIPKVIKEVHQLLSYYIPPGLLVSAMNLHHQLITVLPPEDDTIVPPVDTLMGQLSLKYVWLTCKLSLGESLFQDLLLYAGMAVIRYLYIL